MVEKEQHEVLYFINAAMTIVVTDYFGFFLSSPILVTKNKSETKGLLGLVGRNRTLFFVKNGFRSGDCARGRVSVAIAFYNSVKNGPQPTFAHGVFGKKTGYANAKISKHPDLRWHFVRNQVLQFR